MAILVSLASALHASDAAKIIALDATMWVERRLALMRKESELVDQHQIVFVERESSLPDPEVIILLHGFTAEKNNWYRFTRSIPAEFRVLAIDWPAHGESSFIVDADYSISAQADRLRLLMESLAIENAHLVGNSMGGAIAANFASRFPSRVSTLTLMNSGGADNPQTESEIEISLKKDQNPLLAKSSDSFARVLDLSMERPPFIPWPISEAMGIISAERYAQYSYVFDQVHDGVTNVDYDYLRNITAPTLIIWGGEDRILDVGNAHVFAKFISNSRVVIYEGVGHMPMLEEPVTSASDVAEFIMSATF